MGRLLGWFQEVGWGDCGIMTVLETWPWMPSEMIA